MGKHKSKVKHTEDSLLGEEHCRLSVTLRSDSVWKTREKTNVGSSGDEGDLP